jgi:hypothetical protein
MIQCSDNAINKGTAETNDNKEKRYLLKKWHWFEKCHLHSSSKMYILKHAADAQVIATWTKYFSTVWKLTRGRCYDHNFRRFFPIVGKKMAFFLKINVIFTFYINKQHFE